MTAWVRGERRCFGAVLRIDLEDDIVTMLAMWLDDKSVLLATDRSMGNNPIPVNKLHRISSTVVFGVGFGDNAYPWLERCHYHRHHAYPEHWSQCPPLVNTTEALECKIVGDLNVYRFPEDASLTLCIAGVTKDKGLEAFTLNGRGERNVQLRPGELYFNPYAMRADNQLTGKFWSLRSRFEAQGCEDAGAKALRNVCEEFIRECDRDSGCYIGLGIQFAAVKLGSPLEYHEKVFR